MSVYKSYVDEIQEITGMTVPVIYDDDEANFSGGAYAGFAGYEDVIAPEWYMEEPMFEFEDFLEQEHIKYFHVGLPSTIYEEGKNCGRDFIMGELLNSVGLTHSVEAVEVFVILHEFGHAHDLFYKCGADIIKYLKTRQERNQIIYELKQGGLNSYDSQRRYRQITTEKYADDFAKKYIKQVLSSLARNKKAA